MCRGYIPSPGELNVQYEKAYESATEALYNPDVVPVM
jgi:hypothetical protein